MALDSKKSEKDLLLVSKAKLSVYSCFTKILWRGTHQLPKFDVDPNDSFDGIYHIHIKVTSDKAKKKRVKGNPRPYQVFGKNAESYIFFYFPTPWPRFK